jgi:hypothetical protein
VSTLDLISCISCISFMSQAELSKVSESQAQAAVAQQQRTKELEMEVELHRKTAEEARAAAYRERQEKETERKRAEEAAEVARCERQEKEAERKRAEAAERVAQAARATAAVAKPKPKKASSSSSEDDSNSDDSESDSESSGSGSDSDSVSDAAAKVTAVPMMVGRAKHASRKCEIVIDDDENECAALASVARAKNVAAPAQPVASAALASKAQGIPQAPVQGNNVFVVEQILSHRKVQNEREYLIKWKGYDRHEDNTWEPEFAFKEKHLVKTYLKEQEQKLAAQAKADKNATKTSQEATNKIATHPKTLTIPPVFGFSPSPSIQSVESISTSSTSKNRTASDVIKFNGSESTGIKTAKRYVSFAPSVPIASTATTSGSNVGSSGSLAVPNSGRPNALSVPIVPILPKSAARPATSSTSLLALAVAPINSVSSVGGANTGLTEYSYIQRFRDEFAGVLSERTATGATRNFKIKCELCNFTYVDTLDMTYMTQRMEIPRWTDHKLPFLLPHLMEKHRQDHRFEETLLKLKCSYGLMPCSHCGQVVKDLGEHMSAKHPERIIVIEEEAQMPIPVPSMPAVPQAPVARVAASQAPISTASSLLSITLPPQSTNSVETKIDRSDPVSTRSRATAQIVSFAPSVSITASAANSNITISSANSGSRFVGSAVASALSAAVASVPNSAAKFIECPVHACKSKFSTQSAALQHYADKHKDVAAATAPTLSWLTKRKVAGEPSSTSALLSNSSDQLTPASKKTRIRSDTVPVFATLSASAATSAAVTASISSLATEVATPAVLPAVPAIGIASATSQIPPVPRVHVCASSSKCQLPCQAIPPNPSPELWRVEDLTMVRQIDSADSQSFSFTEWEGGGEGEEEDDDDDSILIGK